MGRAGAADGGACHPLGARLGSVGWVAIEVWEMQATPFIRETSLGFGVAFLVACVVWFVTDSTRVEP